MDAGGASQLEEVAEKCLRLGAGLHTVEQSLEFVYDEKDARHRGPGFRPEFTDVLDTGILECVRAMDALPLQVTKNRDAVFHVALRRNARRMRQERMRIGVELRRLLVVKKVEVQLTR